MPRPRKVGLEYFPLDCTFDSKIDMLRAEHGNDGFFLWITLLQEAYQSVDGTVDCSSIIRRKTLGNKVGISQESVSAMIFTCCEIGLFDKTLYSEQQLVSSNGIKKRICAVTNRRNFDRNRKSEGIPPENASIPELSTSFPSLKGKGKGKEKRVKKLSTPEDCRIAERMRTMILGSFPKTTEPDLEKWASDIRLLREIDGHSAQDIEGVFDWAHSDSFWRSNILCPNKLREKWNQLTARMESNFHVEQNARPQNNSTKNVSAYTAALSYDRHASLAGTASLDTLLAGRDGRNGTIPPGSNGGAVNNPSVPAGNPNSVG